MSIWCRIGIHDWEIIESKYVGSIFCVGDGSVSPDYKYKKVCLKCGKKVNEIEERETRIAKEKKDHNNRNRLAKELWENP